MESVGIFLGLDTQWRVVATFGGLLLMGLDYTAVDAYLRMRRIAPARRPDILSDLQVMENEALVAHAEQAAREAAKATVTTGAPQ